VHHLGVVNWPLSPDEIAAQHAEAFHIGVFRDVDPGRDL
jgi:hypothetical protein